MRRCVAYMFATRVCHRHSDVISSPRDLRVEKMADMSVPREDVSWHEDASNAAFVYRLRNVIADGRLLVFLGAGLSFGAARRNGGARFDYHKYDRWWPHEFPFTDLMPDDDG